MSRKPVTPFRLFKVLMSILIYISVSIGWLLFTAPDLIDSTSGLDVAGALFGTAVWLIGSACLFLFITTPKPGETSNTKEKGQ
ncbi:MULTISPECIES: hypothetical protein [Pseudomonas]|uniref:Uncharacterized protein n=1 Tax=Pseudomonas tritici TaxID=2745518 RepID=A0A8H9YPU9_9PSED|nr:MULTISPECIES: hypothetical protein [Pseudomonas]MBP2871206.1 hypothetical protein [Pseudomonas sp. SWRI144]QXH83284.1 hypothetical protein HU722_0025480 [Pseudomonas tritici]